MELGLLLVFQLPNSIAMYKTQRYVQQKSPGPAVALTLYTYICWPSAILAFLSRNGVRFYHCLMFSSLALNLLCSFRQYIIIHCSQLIVVYSEASTMNCSV